MQLERQKMESAGGGGGGGDDAVSATSAPPPTKSRGIMATISRGTAGLLPGKLKGQRPAAQVR